MVYPLHVLGTCADDCGAASLETIGGRCDDWLHVWRKQAHDEECDSLADSLDELLETWDLSHDASDGADNLVAECEQWIDLLDCLLWVDFVQVDTSKARCA